MKLLLTALFCFGLFSVQAQTDTYTTTTSINSEPLDWDDPDSWVGGVVPVLANNGRDHIINLNHDIIKTGSLTVHHTDIITADNKTFTVNGNFKDDLDAGSHTAGSGSIWDITGNLDVSTTTNFSTGSGTVKVGGNLITGGATKVSVDGTLLIAGAISLGGSSHIEGAGVVTWATLSLAGGSYVGACYTPSGATPPPNSGLDLSDCSVSLPVELISFTSDCNGEGVLIKWVTATETDNDFFEIQKAVGSFEFVTIDEIDGLGTSKTEANYSYLDNRENRGLTVYYRLRQVDFNGEYEYSRIIVSNCDDLDIGFSIYPTVSNGEYTLSFDAGNEFVVLQLINELGQVVKVLNHTNTEKSSEFKFDLNGFSSGVYYAKVLLHNHYEVAKLIKR